jgi:hypothetical protein
MMRSSIFGTAARSGLAAAAAFSVTAIAGVPSATPPAVAGGNLPYCVARDSDVSCDFYSFSQCEATSFNTGQSCLMNPGPIYAVSAKGLGSIRDSQTSASSETIRRNCIARAQAQYPDSGLGTVTVTVTVITQRTEVYADCARANEINP